MGTVKILSEEDSAEQVKIDQRTKRMREEQEKDIGNLKGTMDALSPLASIHGQGKPSKKSRRFARRSADAVRTSQKVRATGLREAAGSSSSSEDDEP